jgi:hypothetical protein
MFCPECDSRCESDGLDSNAVTCPVCSRLVYVVRDPRNYSAMYAAISNSDALVVPNNVLTYPIVVQSPANEPPRNMIMELSDGHACLIAQCSKPTRLKRKTLVKTASALNRDVIAVHLPLELMSYIRSASVNDG